MWLVELFLISVVAGTILGVCWRIFDDWREKQDNKSLYDMFQGETALNRVDSSDLDTSLKRDANKNKN